MKIYEWKGPNIGEGAVGTVRGDEKGKISSRRISEIVPKGQQVSFLKIDVEGTELSALLSAKLLLDLDRIDNILVEFGPPNRWMQVTHRWDQMKVFRY